MVQTALWLARRKPEVVLPPIITEVKAFNGQAVPPGDKLFYLDGQAK